MVKRTSPAIVFGELGRTSSRPTVNRESSEREAEKRSMDGTAAQAASNGNRIDFEGFLDAEAVALGERQGVGVRPMLAIALSLFDQSRKMDSGVPCGGTRLRFRGKQR